MSTEENPGDGGVTGKDNGTSLGTEKEEEPSTGRCVSPLPLQTLQAMLENSGSRGKSLAEDEADSRKGENICNLRHCGLRRSKNRSTLTVSTRQSEAPPNLNLHVSSRA